MKQIIAVDSQRLTSMKSCMYAYKLSYGGAVAEGHQPLVTPEYYEKGDLIHKMLETYYKLKIYRSRWAQNKKTHQDIVQSCITVGRHRAVKMSLDIVEIENAIDTFILYTDYWENDGWNNIAFVEKVGSKILYESENLVILYEVKIDLGLILNGIVTPVDHKTAKSRRDPNALADQFLGYAWFLGCNYLLVNEIGFQKTLGPKDKFRRHSLALSDPMIQEWREEAIYWISHSVDLMNRGLYPRNTTSCDKYSGCKFKQPVCLQDPSIREFKLNQFFEKKTWDIGGEHL